MCVEERRCSLEGVRFAAFLAHVCHWVLAAEGADSTPDSLAANTEDVPAAGSFASRRFDELLFQRLYSYDIPGTMLTVLFPTMFVLRGTLYV